MYWPTIGHLYCMTSFFIGTIKRFLILLLFLCQIIIVNLINELEKKERYGVGENCVNSVIDNFSDFIFLFFILRCIRIYYLCGKRKWYCVSGLGPSSGRRSCSLYIPVGSSLIIIFQEFLFQQGALINVQASIYF